MRKLFTASLLLVVSILNAQETLNELLKQYSSYKKSDTTRCTILLKLIDFEEDLDQIQIYNDELIKITQANLNKHSAKPLRDFYTLNYGNAAYNEANLLSYKNESKKAITFAKKALVQHQKMNRIDEVSADLNIIAYNNQLLGNLKEAIYYFEKSIQIAQSAIDTENLSTPLHNLSALYASQSNYAKAIELQFKILKISEKTQNEKYTADCLSAIGIFYLELNDEQKAVEYLKKALQKQRKIKNDNGIATIYFHLGSIEQRHRHYEKALDYLFKSSQLERDTNSYKTVAKIGQIYRLKKEYEAALLYLNKAVALTDKSENQFDLAAIYQEMGTVYLQLKQHEKAQYYLKKAIELSEKFKIIETQIGSYKLLSELESEKKNFESALTLFKKSAAIKDSLTAVDSKNLLITADYNYQTEKKEAQLKALSQQNKIKDLENQRQKAIIVFGIIGILSVLSVSYLLFKRYKSRQQNELLRTKHEQTRKTLLAEKKAAESELKALKSQMNPHFIFNALNSIQDQFMFGDKAVANEQMGNFTNLTRQILNVSGKKQILISTEIDILTKYLELEKMRFATDFDYQIKLAENIDEDYHEIPPMLIQPFVENSIKHGLLHKFGNKELLITFELDPEEKYIICTIEDNGIGRKKSAEIKSRSTNSHESFSTAALQQRLEIWNGEFNKEIIYQDLTDSRNEPVGTRVVLKIIIQ